MTLVNNVDTNTSYTLKFMRTQYTGAKLTYTGTTSDEQTGKNILHEIRDEYYTRYHFNCKLNIISTSRYKIIEGKNSSWVDSKNYTSTSGSTVVTLKNEYLKTLSADEHKLTFIYTDGECSTNFEIKKTGETYEKSDNTEIGKSGKNSDNPPTGDNSNILLWTSLFTASLLGMLVTAVYNKKKKCMI